MVLNNMGLESWVILIILGIAGYMIVRSNRKMWALGVLPLMLVPVLNIIYNPIAEHLVHIHPGFLYTENLIRLIIYIVGFLMASFWVIFIARRLPKGRSKYAYIVSSILFTAILIIIFVIKVVRL